jgi:peptidoglycan hydrolase-like protein with peptidoglycan-binding domain
MRSAFDNQCMSTIYRHRVLPSQVKQVHSDERSVASAGALSEGASGADVEALQRLLRGVGAYSGSVTGTFDAATKAAVARLQTTKGLTATGSAGAAELKALKGEQLDVKRGFKTYGREGEKGSDIRSEQAKLTDLGFSTGREDGAFDKGTLDALRRFRKADKNLPDKPVVFTQHVASELNGKIQKVEGELKLAGEKPGKIDGTFNAQTASAVRDFQKKHHLKQTGIADAKTRSALDKASAHAGQNVPRSQYQKGYDTSMWQSQAEFNGALNKKGTRFMGVKATDGTSWVDPTFKQRWAEMGKKLQPGKFDARIAYHFLEPGNGTAQANHFLNTVGVHGKLKPGTKLALDWEGAALGSTGVLRDAAKRIHQVTGEWPLIYTSASEVGRAKAAVPHAPIWDAHYPPDAADYKNLFVQKSGSGVDADVFTGNQLALEKWAGWLG